MPSNKGYDVTSRGTNDQGNHYDSRDYSKSSGGNPPANDNSYHYSNSNGSYYYSNPNGSNYYNSGKGYAEYTAPDGQSGWKSNGGK